MIANALPVLVVVLVVLLQLWMMFKVAVARGRSGIEAPATTGDPALERAIRVHANTVEQLLMFLPSLWLTWTYWSPLAAGIGGLIWIAGRVWYALGYWQDAKKRSHGFLLGGLATLGLLVGGSIAWLWRLFF